MGDDLEPLSALMTEDPALAGGVGDPRRDAFLRTAYRLLFDSDGDMPVSSHIEVKRHEAWQDCEKFAAAFDWAHPMWAMDRMILRWLIGKPGESGERIPGYLWEAPRNAYDRLPEVLVLSGDAAPNPKNAALRIKHCQAALFASKPDSECICFVASKEEWRMALQPLFVGSNRPWNVYWIA